jgi:hypothetical protein
MLLRCKGIIASFATNEKVLGSSPSRSTIYKGSKMSDKLTRDYKETIRERCAREPEFAELIIKELEYSEKDLKEMKSKRKQKDKNE